MESQLIDLIKDNEIKPRRHPGVMKIRTAEVPAMTINAMQVIMKGKYKIINDFNISWYFNTNVDPFWVMVPCTCGLYCRCFRDPSQYSKSTWCHHP
jgi:hypothetical protein